LPVSVSNLVPIGSQMAELWPFNWFQNGGRRHLGFLHCVNFDGKYVCSTLFSTYISNSVQVRAKMAELWLKMWLSIWRTPPSWILLDTSSEGKSCPGIFFSVSVSNLVQIRSEMAELWPFTDFAATLDFCTMWILAVNLTVGPYFQPMFQIRCKCVQ